MAQQTVDGLLPTEALSERLRQKRDQKTGTARSYFRWSRSVPEPRGPLDFQRYPFQRELYSQEVAFLREVVIKKATQVGVSAWLVRWALFHADVRGLNVLYVFPKLQQMHDFSSARVAVAIEKSAYLRRRIPYGYINNKGLKRIGTGWLYSRGSESKTALDSVDAQALCLDEYDTLNRENIPDAERRISGAEEGLVRRVGVPSIPGQGIDKSYQRTDQRRWFVKCECGISQPLTYDRNVDEERRIVVCSDVDCRRPLDVRRGEWVAAYPDRDIRGYHIPRLIVAHADIGAIVDAHHSEKPYELKAHFNKDLAEAWAEEEGRLSDEVLDAATRDFPRDAGQSPGGGIVTMGIDVASVRNLNVKISLHHDVEDEVDGERHYKTPLYVGEAKNFTEVGRLFERFNVSMAVVDYEPEYRMARNFAERYPGRVYLVNFATQEEVFKVKPEMRRVSVRRVEAIDATFEMIRQQRNLIPRDAPPGYRDQLQALTRVVERDEKTDKIKVRYDSGGQDFDYAMAEVYDMLAYETYLFHQDVSAGVEGTEQPIDEMYEFERSDLVRGGDVSLDEYDPGFHG